MSIRFLIDYSIHDEYVAITSTSLQRVHTYRPAPAGFAAKGAFDTPSRDADITEGNNIQNQHDLSGRIPL
jgi:hypothetical protein